MPKNFTFLAKREGCVSIFVFAFAFWVSKFYNQNGIMT